jgi:hypothetical protein
MLALVCYALSTVVPWVGSAASVEGGTAEPEWILSFPAEWDSPFREATGRDGWAGQERRERLAGWLAERGLTLLDSGDGNCLVRGTQQQILRLQKEQPELLIQPNYTYRLDTSAALHRIDRIGPDPFSDQQWGLELIRLEQGWELLRGREVHEVVVAVVDSGIDLDHPDLSAQVLRDKGYNALSKGSPPEDDNGHGTHVAGVIAATVGNGEGVRGVAGFPFVKVLPIKVMDETGSGSTYNIAKGIDYAVEQQVDVINLSVGGPEEDPFIREAVKRAVRKGIPVVAAAGNDGGSARYSTPANVKEAITVGAVQRDRKRLPESNYGPEVDLVAPGEQVLSTYWRKVTDYAYMTGTSAATPFVSGVVALMKAVNPDLTVEAIEKYLTRNTEPLGTIDGTGRNDQYGYGLLRSDKVLQKVLEHVDTGVPTYPDPLEPGSPDSPPADDARDVPVFPDVPATHWASVSIAHVVSQGWFGGFPDGTFKPGETMRRAQAAAVFTKILDLPLAVPRFWDIRNGFWAAYAVGAVQQSGLMTGDQGYFKPDQPMTRAQFAKVLAKAYELSYSGAQAEPNGRVNFPDVRPGDWYAPYVDVVASLGLMRGNETGKFLPNRPITRAEVSVILHRYDERFGQR